MPEGSEETTNAENYGLPLDRFESAVDAVVELRDTGKLLIFLTRRGRVKLIGDIEEFRKEFISQTKDEFIDIEQSKKAQSEIRNLASAVIRLTSTDAVLEYMERFSFEDFSNSEDTVKNKFKDRQRPKIDIVSNKIATAALRQRAKRLATATGACVEELDFEVVSSREDAFRDRSIEEPFLRLRLRYSEGAKGDIPFYGYFFVSYEGSEGGAAPGFEFECDLSDLDLLLKRLQAAKQRLLKLQEPNGGAK